MTTNETRVGRVVAVVFDGPQSDVAGDGEEIPVWCIVAEDGDGNEVEIVWTHSYAAGCDEARRMKRRFPRAEMVWEATAD